MILKRLFDHIFRNGTILVATSNRAPDGEHWTCEHVNVKRFSWLSHNIDYLYLKYICFYFGVSIWIRHLIKAENDSANVFTLTDLYKNGLQRSSFVPFIGVLKANCQSVQLDSGIDYRSKGSLNAARPFYFMCVIVSTFWKSFWMDEVVLIRLIYILAIENNRMIRIRLLQKRRMRCGCRNGSSVEDCLFTRNRHDTAEDINYQRTKCHIQVRCNL